MVFNYGQFFFSFLFKNETTNHGGNVGRMHNINTMPFAIRKFKHHVINFNSLNVSFGNYIQYSRFHHLLSIFVGYHCEQIFLKTELTIESTGQYQLHHIILSRSESFTSNSDGKHCFHARAPKK